MLVCGRQGKTAETNIKTAGDDEDGGLEHHAQGIDAIAVQRLYRRAGGNEQCDGRVEGSTEKRPDKQSMKLLTNGVSRSGASWSQVDIQQFLQSSFTKKMFEQGDWPGSAMEPPRRRGGPVFQVALKPHHPPPHAPHHLRLPRLPRPPTGLGSHLLQLSSLICQANIREQSNHASSLLDLVAVLQLGRDIPFHLVKETEYSPNLECFLKSGVWDEGECG